MENKYEIQEKKIETLREQVENLRQLAIKEDNEIEEAIKAKIQELTPNKLWFSIDSRRSYDNYWRVEIGFINEEGKTDFGSTFIMYVYPKETHTHKASIYINQGTMGEWCVEEHPYQYSRIILINQIMENRASLWLFFKDLEKKQVLAPIFEKLRQELEQEESYLRYEKRQDTCAEIKAKLIPGAELQYGGMRIKITKLTPKRVYYYRWVEVWAPDACAENGYRTEWKYSGVEEHMKLDETINKIYYDFEENKGRVQFLN